MKKTWCLLALIWAGCQSWDRTPKLTLYNHSDKTIYYWLSCDSSYDKMQIRQENRLEPGKSIMPYLLYGPEGKGKDSNPWINAINRADDTALHIFCLYIDFDNDPDRTDSLYNLII